MEEIEKIKLNLKNTIQVYENKRKKYFKTSIVIMVIINILGILILQAMFSSNSGGDSIGDMIQFLIIGNILVYSYFSTRYSKVVKKTVMPFIVNKVLVNSYYKESNKEEEEFIKDLELFKLTSVKLNDCIFGEYNKVNYTFSNLEITYGSGKNKTTQFKGTWYSFSYYMGDHYELKIRESKKGFFNKSADDYETESIEFNDNFAIKANSPNVVYQLLTPGMIEKILNFNDKYKGKVFLAYKNNKFYLGVSNNKAKFKLYLHRMGRSLFQ